jgi:phospholipase D1/2
VERAVLMRWTAQAYVPTVKHGHVVPGVALDVVKAQLASVRGSLVQMPLVRSIRFSMRGRRALTTRAQDFLVDQKDFVDNLTWSGLDPLLPIYT